MVFETLRLPIQVQESGTCPLGGRVLGNKRLGEGILKHIEGKGLLQSQIPSLQYAGRSTQDAVKDATRTIIALLFGCICFSDIVIDPGFQWMADSFFLKALELL